MTDTDTAPRVQGFICLSRDLTWGWGATQEDAVRQARRANGGSGARKGDRVVYALPEGALDAWVDQMGGVNWTWADDAPDRTARGITVEEPKA
jgi:hypothetical protein